MTREQFGEIGTFELRATVAYQRLCQVAVGISQNSLHLTRPLNRVSALTAAFQPGRASKTDIAQRELRFIVGEAARVNSC